MQDPDLKQIVLQNFGVQGYSRWNSGKEEQVRDASQLPFTIQCQGRVFQSAQAKAYIDTMVNHSEYGGAEMIA